MDKPVYSFVVPIFNEEETLPELDRRLSALMDQLDGDAEAILIDDGSRDKSFAMMLELSRRDPRYKVAQLSRNFGHQVAITAGMDLAIGQAVIIMDADLQDPPEVVLEMAARWREGYDIVYGVREERSGETLFKKFTASIFYRILRKLTDLDIPVDVGDFRLVDCRAMNAFKQLREHGRYVRGMFSWIGFKQTGVWYKRSERFAGETKYPLKKMLKLAMDGVLSFSVVPLRMALHIGFVIAWLSFFAGIATVILKIARVQVIPGWASLVTLSSFLGGVQLIVLGIMGEYVGRIYEEVRNRPLYLISGSYGFGTNVQTSAVEVTSPEGNGGNPERLATHE